MSKLLTKAESLHSQGFTVIPVRYKIPTQQNWQNERIEPNGNFDNANGVGIVTGTRVPGGYFCAMDADCLVKEVSNDFYGHIANLKGKVPFRVGNAPKFMIPFICTERLPKKVTPYYDDSRVEILGQGQQVVCHGFASEGVKYRWFNGEIDINDIPRWTVEEVEQLMQAFESIALNHGLKAKSQDSKTIDDDFLVDVPSNREDISDEAVAELLTRLDPNPLDYDSWVSVGMAVHHQTEGRGYDIWLKWSERSDKHDQRHMKIKWNSFDNEGKRVITLGTVRMLINQQSVIDMDNPFDFEEITDNVDDVISKNEGSQDFPSAADIELSHLSQFWQVEDMLEKGSIAQIYGASYTGKSYFIMYMAACMASGHSFGDKRTISSKVVYVYGEGNHGVKRRFQAVKQHYPELDMTNLHYSKSLPNLMDEKSFLKFGKSLKAFGGADVIIFDTLARSMSGGDENSAMDMGLVLQRLAKLRDVFGCSVIVVHHSGKDATKGARGSSATYAGMDNEIKVEKDDNGVIQIESTKAKDSPEYKPMNFRFVPVVFDIQDNFGRDITSATVEFVEDYEAQESMKKLSPSGREVVDVVKYLAEKPECHVTPPVDFARDSGLNSPSFGILSSEVREQFERRQRDSSMPDSTIRQKWRRGLQDAVSKGILSQLDEVIVIL